MNATRRGRRRSPDIGIALLVYVVSALAPASVQAQTADRVIVISIDGLRSDAIDAAPALALQALIAGGSYDPRCLNELPPSTLPNHASMVTGLSVTEHGILANGVLDGFIAETTIFDIAAGQGRRVAFLVSKTKLGFLCRPEAADVRVIDGDIERIATSLLENFANDPPNLTFVHFREPDGGGHRDGWMSAPYLAAVRQVDALIGSFLSELAALGLREGTVLVITADHGGFGNTHAWSIPAVRFVPLILNGPGFRAGHRICAQTRNRDVGPIAAAIIGLQGPAEWLNRVPADALLDGAPEDAACTPAPLPMLGLPCMVLPLSVALASAIGWRRRLRPCPAGSPRAPDRLG
ncbi:MAG: alkaline phosphatase family protein [Phycisphaerae bacterium]